MSKENYQIEKIGMEYIPDLNILQIKVLFRNCYVIIPMNRMAELLKTFEDYYKGGWVEDLKGRYVRLIFDDENGKICAIQHIIDDGKIYFTEKSVME